MSGGGTTSYYNRLKKRNDRRRFWSHHESLKKGLIGVTLFVLVCVLLVLGIYLSRHLNSDSPGNGFYATEASAEVELDQNGRSLSTATSHPEAIPDYSGEDVIPVNDGIPNFSEADIRELTGDYYSPLDQLGRCGAAYARLDRTMMPTQERSSIGMIKPSGWKTVKYPDLIEDNYLYNRCHLIAYGLSGENANEQNLITGTRYMNSVTMYEYELMVMQYLDQSSNHVLYRVTPFFKGDELVARGVEMEAYSIEDRGSGVCYHVFIYNRQPGIEIDYRTGESNYI